MDDILIKIEKKNCEIESLLEKKFELSLEDVSNINKLYSEKRDLINKFINERKKIENIKLISKDKQYWQNKFDSYLSKDKSVLDKLNDKVQFLANSIRQSQENKRLLIYKKH
jgi:hypothetical protein